MPPITWWMSTVELRVQYLLPLVPPDSSTAPMLAALPKQIVATSGLISCMVS